MTTIAAAIDFTVSEVADQDVMPLSTCTQCGGTDLRRTTVRSAFWEGERLVVVEDIPALVCADCREQYYEDQTVVLLDLMRGTGFPADKAVKEISVPVFSLRTADQGFKP